MSTIRKGHSPKFKFQIALEAAKCQKTVNQLASEHQLHPSQISQWKRRLLEQSAQIFSSATAGSQLKQQAIESDLYYSSPHCQDKNSTNLRWKPLCS